jgi:hypothetical protein
LLRHGSLDFYPPRSGADFASYFWTESIPPGVASLHAWAYACGGKVAAIWTAPVVLLQFWSLHDLLWRMGNALAGPMAARAACLAAAACPLLNWSLFIGQETGLTAVALLGLVFALLPAAPGAGPGGIGLAALFAALGSSAREYGLIFPAFGAVVLLVRRVPPRTLGTFLAGATPVSLAWLARTFVLTGNPVYSLDLASLPTNELFATWREHDRSLHAGTLAGATGWLAVLRYLGLFAPAALLGWLCLAVGRVRHAGLLAAATVLLLALWFASVSHTSGGLFYSLRVAGPAFAVGALATGLMASRLGPAFGIALGTLLIATLPQTLTLPRNAWRIPVTEWSGVRDTHDSLAAQDQRATQIAAALGGARLLVADGAGHQPRLARRGVTVLPPWSPDAEWLFDPAVDAGVARQAWRRTGIRHVLVEKFGPTASFIRARARWLRPPFHSERVWEDASAILLKIDCDPR